MNSSTDTTSTESTSTELNSERDFASLMETLQLAGPDQRPNADVVIFDGDCHFCQTQVRRLNFFDGGERLSFISLHDPRVAERFPDLTHEEMMEQMYIVSANGKRRGGARAIRYLSRRLPRLWWLAPVMHIPFSLPFWQWAYRKVAVRRYRWNQKHAPVTSESDEVCKDACKIHLGK